MNAEKSIKFLTKLVKKDPNFDVKNFDLVELLAPTETEKNDIQSQCEDCNLYEVKGIYKLCKALAKRVIYPPIEKKLIKFFRKVHANEFVYKKENDPDPLRVVDVVYKYYFYNKFYIVAQPLELFYKWGKTDDIDTNIKVPYKHVEKQLEKLFKFLKIDASSYFEDYVKLWTEEIDEVEYKFIKLAVKSWKAVKKETNSNLFGFIMEGTGIHDTFNLDTGEDANFDEDIINYVKKQGLDIQPLENDETE
jgi:hypothetical protein